MTMATKLRKDDQPMLDRGPNLVSLSLIYDPSHVPQENLMRAYEAWWRFWEERHA